jgi:hypothetical protein
MNCYVCDTHGHNAAAVGVCQHCGAALCRTHLASNLTAPRTAGPGQRGSCSHILSAAAA